MSYLPKTHLPETHLPETHLPETHVEMVGRGDILSSSRTALPLLLLLAFLYGSLYALFLPPWGLIDEAQHFHYIQYIATQQALPVARDLYLSQEIVDSLFATHRWETFHWTPPSAPDPAVMGLEGYSYETYQPPLFYLVMTPFYWLLPENTLVKVYGLRLVAVLLSLITVWSVYGAAKLLLPQFPRFPFFAALLLVAIPERAIATSRINNDVLLEVMAALFFVTLTHAALSGLNRRRSLMLGLLLGMALWVKTSGGLLGVPLLLLLWLRRHDRTLWQQIGWMALVAAPFGLSLVSRNLWLYHDLTGFSAFEAMNRLAAVDGSSAAFVHTFASLFNHFWVVWWKGSNVGENGLLTGFYALMAGILLLAWGRLCIDFWRERRNDRVVALLFIYAVTLLIYAVAVVSSYYQGMVPVLQGRFLLPAVLPFVLLLVCGLWRFAKGEQILFAVTVLLWAMGLLSLFGNLLPYFYYWSGVVQGSVNSGVNSNEVIGDVQTLVSIYQRILLDKPPFVGLLLLPLSVGYAATLLFTLSVTLPSIRHPNRLTSFYNNHHSPLPADSHDH